MATCKSRGGFHKADWVSVWISTVPVPEIPQDYLNLDSADQHRLADGFAREFGLTEYPWGLLEFLMEKGGQQFIKWMGPQVEPYAIGRLRMDRRTLVFSYHDEYVEKVLAAAKSLNIRAILGAPADLRLPLRSPRDRCRRGEVSAIRRALFACEAIPQRSFSTGRISSGSRSSGCSTWAAYSSRPKAGLRTCRSSLDSPTRT